MYTITKILNTNVVLLKKSEKEVVAFGSGIGYNKSKGDLIKDSEISKIYIPLENSSIDNFITFINNVPYKYLELSNEIINSAEEIIGNSLSGNILYTLTDHIYFTIARGNESLDFQNAMYWEFKRFYPKEFQAGLKALEIISDRLNVELPEQEAANITFHIINANVDSNLNTNALQMTRLISNIIKSLRVLVNKNIDENSLHYERLETHIKFFAERYLTNTMLNNDRELLMIVTSRYPQGTTIAKKIKTIIEEIYEQKITDEEIAYLSIHIHRILISEK